MKESTSDEFRREDKTKQNIDYHFVIESNELADGERVLIEIQGVEIGVFRVENEFYAVANYCPHQGGPLCTGPISGEHTAKKRNDGWEFDFDRQNEMIVCPWHGWEFDMISGEHNAYSKKRAITYDTELINGHVYIADQKL